MRAFSSVMPNADSSADTVIHATSAIHFTLP
jgi:hypothetical protein